MSVSHQTGKVTSILDDKKTIFTTLNPFEQQFGYHRAVRRGPFIYVSGTTALIETPAQTDEKVEDSSDKVSKVHYPTDARKQAQIVMSRCIDAVERLGGKAEDVIRVKMFVSRHEDCAAIGAALRDSFGSVGDATGSTQGNKGVTATMIVVQNGFVDPDILVEVEVDAVVLDV